MKKEIKCLKACKTFKKTTMVVVCSLVLLLLYFLQPSTQTLNVYVPHELREEKDGREIVSFTGDFGGTIVEGYQNKTDKGDPCYTIELPRKIGEADTLTIVSTSPSIGMNFFWKDTYMQYFGDQTMHAYAKESLEHPRNDFKEYSFVEFLNANQNENHVFLVSVKGNSFDGLNEEMIASLKELGINETPNKNASYVAMVHGDDVFVETSDDSLVEVDESLDGVTFDVISGGITSGNTSSIVIDGVEYSNNRNGMNIVVYNLELMEVVDSVTFNTNVSEVRMSRFDDAFYSEYVTEIQPQLLTQISMRGAMVDGVLGKFYIVVAILLFILYIDIITILQSKKDHEELSNGYMHIRCISVGVLLMVSVASVFGYTYLIEHFKDVTVSQLVFHMHTNLHGTNWNDFKDVYIALGLKLLWSILIASLLFMVGKYCKKNVESKKYVLKMSLALVLRWAVVVWAVVPLVETVEEFFYDYDMYGYLVNVNYDADVFKDYYVAPESVKLTFPEEKKNLVYILMESMEISAADESSGGAKAFNAIPELTKIALDNDCFNGSSTQLNGAIALNNCTWTTAGIVAQNTGLPFEINHEQSNIRGAVQSFMPGAFALGDILSANGYNNAFLLGSDAKFGNRTQFFSEHGDYEIMDYYWAKDTGRIDPNYKVWWGYEDLKLFNFAKEEVTRLAKEDQPFNFTLLTVDTHFTDGYKCEHCKDTFDDQYSNVIACSSNLVGEFVSWIQKQDFGKDTVIVLNGDHLTMDSKYFADKPKEYERKTYTAIVNSCKEELEQERKYATIDLFPTTLSALGVTIEGNRLALGTDLYSTTPTLLEEVGRPYLDSQFTMNSKFYNSKILYNKE